MATKLEYLGPPPQDGVLQGFHIPQGVVSRQYPREYWHVSHTTCKGLIDSKLMQPLSNQNTSDQKPFQNKSETIKNKYLSFWIESQKVDTRASENCVLHALLLQTMMRVG